MISEVLCKLVMKSEMSKPSRILWLKEFNKFVVFNPKNHQQYFVNLFDPPLLAHYKWVSESGLYNSL